MRVFIADLEQEDINAPCWAVFQVHEGVIRVLGGCNGPSWADSRREPYWTTDVNAATLFPFFEAARVRDTLKATLSYISGA